LENVKYTIYDAAAIVLEQIVDWIEIQATLFNATSCERKNKNKKQKKKTQGVCETHLKCNTKTKQLWRETKNVSIDIGTACVKRYKRHG
jgi:hypothetical protein